MGICSRHAVLILLAGCSTTIESAGEQGLTPKQKVAQERWLGKAYPVFKASCTMCHDGSVAANPAYLQGTSDLAVRDAILAFSPQVVNLGAPQSSRVVTKGVHEGPAMSAQQASDVLSWITAQRDATPPQAGPTTTPTPPMLCTSGAPGTPTCPINSVDLTALGAAAATLDFVGSQVGADLYLTDLKVKAGADGAYVEHPLFQSYPGGAMTPTADPLDRFFAVKLDLMANGTATLGDGTATFVGFAPADPLAIQFTAVDKYRPPM